MQGAARFVRTIMFAVLAGHFALPSSLAQQAETPAIGSRQDAELIATLIRSSLMALHHANVTGNYTVLRDLGAPTFRDRNTAGELARIFAPIRAKGIDLEAVAFLQPTINLAPHIDANGMLIITGSFDTPPMPVAFELAFQVVDQTWRLFGLSVGPRPGETAPSDEDHER